MIRGKCPTCGRAVEGPSLDALPHFPFCSERCRLVDLGRWIDGEYAIPGPPAPVPPPTLPGDEEDD
ncbi:DNA gyrase inhibitor YacG [Tautonia sociabilis]|uniref:DNA gyrase inhibitor YacG n=1 Tax=Tautonia sociabilis TaxID=2080755 RepID=A0A432MM03_9BACT|nr:DNA gyrase inhibitor YacG [Tautonia sociabilis]RUL88463.1 DNA gyrase inhibitor YacG [Tautonia sociabilis]